MFNNKINTLLDLVNIFVFGLILGIYLCVKFNVRVNLSRRIGVGRRIFYHSICLL
jgi:hypothetical protein